MAECALRDMDNSEMEDSVIKPTPPTPDRKVGYFKTGFQFQDSPALRALFLYTQKYSWDQNLLKQSSPPTNIEILPNLELGPILNE